jgi:hypothetical protein
MFHTPQQLRDKKKKKKKKSQIVFFFFFEILCLKTVQLELGLSARARATAKMSNASQIEVLEQSIKSYRTFASLRSVRHSHIACKRDEIDGEALSDAGSERNSSARADAESNQTSEQIVRVVRDLELGGAAAAESAIGALALALAACSPAQSLRAPTTINTQQWRCCIALNQ